MTWYNVFKFAHILSVVVMIGGMFARQVVRGIAKKSEDIQAIASLSHVAMRLDRTMVIPGSNFVLVFGVVLALMLKWPIFGFLQGADQNWLLVSNILLIAIMIIIPTVFLPHNRKVDSLVQTALAEGHVTADLKSALHDQKNRLAHYIEEALVLAITALMVLKPF